MQTTDSPKLMREKKLYELCRKYGRRSLLWRQKFIGLLPEVNRRRLYEKKGFSSIYVFAAKLCGLTVDQVNLAINLGVRFKDKPVLMKMLESGAVSINKLTRIVSIATPENEEELAEKIKVLPKSALETWVRDAKAIMQGAENPNKNALQKPFFDGLGLPGHASKYINRQAPLAVQTLKFQIADDIAVEFNELFSKGIDVNEFLREMLQRRRAEIEKKKEEIAENIQPTTSHYISVQIKKILKEEHGKKCSITTCQKPAKTIHHTQRHSLSQNHDPRFLAPLCADHHVIAHSIDIKYHQARAVYSP